MRDGEKALSLNPRDPVLAGVLIETYRALRMYSEGEKLANDTIARVPADVAESLWGYKCDFALALGALDKARAVIEATPGQSAWKNSILATVEFYKHNYAGAAKTLVSLSQETKEPSDAILDAEIQRLRGDSEGSRLAFEQARQIVNKRISHRPDDPNLFGYLAFCYAALGQKEEALAAIQRAAALAPMSQDAVDGANWMGTLAEVYVLTGDSEAALEQLAKVVKLPNGITYGDLLLNPEWDVVRNDPRFDAILAQSQEPPTYN